MIINDNKFNLIINKYNSFQLLNNLIKGKNIKIDNKEKYELLEIINYKPKKIKLLSQLLINGKTFENIKNMKNLKLTNIELNKDDSSFPLYYLLLNMPLGLPNYFLELIFDNYREINDDKNLIIQKNINNWNIIKNDKRFEENFKENKYMDKCYNYIFKALKLYTKVLIFFIEKNREKILYKNGNIHYLFNSYSNRNIWKSKINNSIESLIGYNIYNQDFKMENHKQNIISIISLIVNDIELFRKLKEWSDVYLEEILILFPSYFFLEKDNINLLQICIHLCKKLIEKTKIEYVKKREEYLKQKLLLFLYSIDKSKNEIIKIKEIINSDLEIEINFLKILRNEDKNIKDLENLLSNASNEIKLYIYREISITYFKNEDYNNSLKNLEIILNFKGINNIYKNRIIPDLIYIHINKFKKENEQNRNKIKEFFKKDDNKKYKLIKEQIVKLENIIKRPYQKDLYKEAFKLKDKIYSEFLEPNIVMLNSNPLKNISNNAYFLNNQYYILNKLKKDINKHIRIKSYILNI